MDEQQKPDVNDSQEELEAQLKEEDLEELAGGTGGSSGRHRHRWAAPLTVHWAYRSRPIGPRRFHGITARFNGHTLSMRNLRIRRSCG